MEEIKNQPCPICNKKTLTLREDENDIPYFGKVYIFSMECLECKYHKADIESVEKKDPASYTIVIENEKDLSIRVVKSSTGSIKIPQLGLSVTPNIASEGYVSNIEGVLDRFYKVLEDQRDTAEDQEERKKIKNILKKLWKAKTGDLKLKIIIKDPEGNSAIISDKAVVKKLK